MKIRYTFLLLILLSSGARADYGCTGEVLRINQARNGIISLISPEAYGDSKGRTLCSLGEEWKSVPIEACSGWLSKLLAARATGTKITIQYVDQHGSCSAQPEWGNAESPWAIWEV